MAPTLDPTDLDILAALQRNARLSNKELAHAVHLAPSTCLERVRRLREQGVLLGFHAAVNPEALGIDLQALILVRLARHSREAFEAFRAHVLGLPEVVAAYHVGGANDFMVHVAVRDAHHLRDLALDRFTSRPEVAHLETSLIFEHVVNPALPAYVDAAAGKNAPTG